MSRKKKFIIIILSVVALLLILFAPIPKTTQFDEGTALSLTSLTYKVIFWDMYEGSEKPYNKTDFLLLPRNISSVLNLWDERYQDLQKEGYGAHIMYVMVTEKYDNYILVAEVTNKDNIISISKEKIDEKSIGITFDEIEYNTKLAITTSGIILESYPAIIADIFKIEPATAQNTDFDKYNETSSVESASEPVSSTDNTIDTSSTDSSLAQSSVSSDETTISSETSTETDTSSIDLPMYTPKGFWYQNVHKYPEHYDEKSNLLMPYLVVEPEDYDPTKEYPVILYFHGAGDGYPKREDDEYEYQMRFNRRQAYQFIDGYIYCYEWLDQAIIIMPQLNNGNWWDFYPEEDGPLDAAMRIFDKVTSEFSCDSSRYYVMGPSMGGAATIEVAAKYNDTFAAALPMCAATSINENMAQQLVDMPIMFLHGTADTLIPYTLSEQNCDVIKAAGGNMVSVKLYEGADHDLWRYSLKDDEPFEWLFSQSKE